MKSGGDAHRAEIMAHLKWAAADEGRDSAERSEII